MSDLMCDALNLWRKMREEIVANWIEPSHAPIQDAAGDGNEPAPPAAGLSEAIRRELCDCIRQELAFNREQQARPMENRGLTTLVGTVLTVDMNSTTALVNENPMRRMFAIFYSDPVLQFGINAAQMTVNMPSANPPLWPRIIIDETLWGGFAKAEWFVRNTGFVNVVIQIWQEIYLTRPGERSWKPTTAAQAVPTPSQSAPPPPPSWWPQPPAGKQYESPHADLISTSATALE